MKYEVSPNNKWVTYFTMKKGVSLVNLENRETRNFSHVENSAFSAQEDFLAILDKRNILNLIDLNSQSTTEIDGVEAFSFSPDGRWVAVVLLDGDKTILQLIKVDTDEKIVVLITEQSTFLNLIWNVQSSALAFMEVMRNDLGMERTTLYDFRISPIFRLTSVNPKWDSKFPSGTYISATDEIYFAADGQRIFFNIRPISYLKQNTNAAYRTNTECNGPINANGRNFPCPSNFAHGPWLMQWEPKQKQLLQIGNQRMPVTMVLDKQNFALSFDPGQKGGNNPFSDDLDFFIWNLRTGECDHLHKKQKEDEVKPLNTSPSGRYKAYFKDRHWWVVDSQKGIETNITVDLPFSLSNSDSPLTAYGFAGWSEDEQGLFVYDEFDIWLLSTNGKLQYKITNGRETKAIYRVCGTPPKEIDFQDFPKPTLDKLNLEKAMLLEGNGPDGKSYYVWRKRKVSIEEMILERRRIDNSRKILSILGPNFFHKRRSILSSKFKFLKKFL